MGEVKGQGRGGKAGGTEWGRTVIRKEGERRERERERERKEDQTVVVSEEERKGAEWKARRHGLGENALRRLLKLNRCIVLPEATRCYT